jgi:hypothetical protein
MEQRSGEDRRLTDVTHGTLLAKLVEHDGSIADLNESVCQINEKLDPISDGIRSIAFAFKALLIIGAGSAAIVGIIELVKHFE